MANSFSKAARLGPLNNLIEEKTRAHWWCSSFSIVRYFRVRSRSGIFLAYGFTLTPDTKSVPSVILRVEFNVTYHVSTVCTTTIVIRKVETSVLPLVEKASR